MEDTIMVIAPHPDDAEIGMGGTIAALTGAGRRVIVIDLTDGEPTPYGSPQVRKQEAAEASRILGITERAALDITNREVFDTVENRKKLSARIREYKPSMLFIPYWEDAHPDHIKACGLAESARFYAKFVKCDLPHQPHYPRKLLHYFSTHIRPRFQPSFVFDISGHIDTKMQAVAAYRSQFSENPRNKSILQVIRNESAHWGFQVQTEFGEPFICRENIRLTSWESLSEI